MTREHRSFPSGDEWCAAYVYRPAHPDPAAAADADPDAGVPCVVMAHGFSATRDDLLPVYAERFAAAGCAVVLFDYRHFGQSTGAPRQLLDIGRQLDDYRAALRFARALPGIDRSRIALWGTSFSGGHVLTLGAEDHDVAAIVAQVPFADGLSSAFAVPPTVALRGAALGALDLLAATVGLGPITMRAVGPPGSFAVMTAPEAEPGMAEVIAGRSRWRNAVAARIMLTVGLYRPGPKAGRIACPLLVCVADGDETTPPGPAIAAAQRAPRGELRRYPGGHFALYGELREQAIADQTAFLARHLALTRTPTAA